MTSREDVLSSHALVAFAFVEDAYAKTGDVVAGLLPLFAPLLVGKTGRPFDPKTFAQDVSARYGIPMSPLVAEGLIERLAEADLLYLESENSRVYRISAVTAPRSVIDESAIESVLNKFVEFANRALRPLGQEQTSEWLKTEFLSRLTSAQFLSAVERKERNYFVGRKLTLKKDDEPEDAFDLGPAVDVLSAEFALRSMEGGGDSADLLVKIAAGALIAEVVLTLQAPGGVRALDKLSIFIDAPILLDLLDLSSVELREFAISLFDLMDKAKVKLAVFSHTIEEMRGTILGPLDAMRRGEEPFGPLGSRARLDPKHAAYARGVLDTLDEKLRELQISVLDANELRTEAGLLRLSADTEESLRNNVGPLHVGLERRIKDAASIASIMRLRCDRKSNSIADSGSLFVTRNPVVAALSRSHLIFKSFIDRDEVPPAITDRMLAGYLWFVVGGNVGDITRKKLIANCSYVMMPRNDIISKARQYLTEIDPEKAKVFSAILSDNRAQRCLVRATLGLPSAITTSNVDDILQQVRESVASEVIERAERREAEIEQSYQTQLSALATARSDEARRYEAEILTEKMRADALIERGSEQERRSAAEIEGVRSRLVLAESDLRNDVDLRMHKAVAAGNWGKRVVVVLFVIAYLVLVWVSYTLSPAWGAWKEFIGIAVAFIGFWLIPELTVKFLGAKVWKWRFGRAIGSLGLQSHLHEFHVDPMGGRADRKSA